MKVTWFFILGFVGIVSSQTQAQVHDAGSWISVTIQKKINKKNSILLSEEVRLNENYTEAGNIFTELGYQYKLSKRIDVTLALRYANKQQLENSYSQRLRYMLTTKYTHFLSKKITINARLRWQQQWNDIPQSSTLKTLDSQLRVGAGADCQTSKKISIGCFAETFYEIKPPLLLTTRYTVAATYYFNKQQSIELGGVNQYSHNEYNPSIDWVTTISYKYKW